MLTIGVVLSGAGIVAVSLESILGAVCLFGAAVWCLS